MVARHCRRSTAARRDCSCRTSTSGRARNGFEVSVSCRAMSLASGKNSATTTAATRGANSGIVATPEVTGVTSTRLLWRLATVVAARDETRHARTLELEVAEWPGHRAGQHVDIRLVAEDGYQA